jgi:hypothetical protein
LWRWLTDWNVLEFKGPTVSARVGDLDSLAELGLGVHRRLNEQRSGGRRPLVDRPAVSFWYLAPRLGRRFLRDAATLLGPLEQLGEGVWRTAVLRRPLLLVSARVLPVDRESAPLHALAGEEGEARAALAQVLEENLDLWPRYGGWISMLDPVLGKEIDHMARVRNRQMKLDLKPVIEVFGPKAVLESVGPEQLLEELGPEQFLRELGPERLVEAVGRERLVELLGPERLVELLGRERLLAGLSPDELLANLTPQQRREFERRFRGGKSGDRS